MEGGGVQNSPLVFFFKYLQTGKRYDFVLLWLLVITYFKWCCQIYRENFDWLTSYCDFVRGVPKNSKKKSFFQTTFFKQIFLQNISSTHYVEVVNMIFFIWNHIFLLVFENKYIRIGNFIVFLSESMELTSDRFFIYFVKQFASIYLFCSFYNKECHLLSFITAVFS